MGTAPAALTALFARPESVRAETVQTGGIEWVHVVVVLLVVGLVVGALIIRRRLRPGHSEATTREPPNAGDLQPRPTIDPVADPTADALVGPTPRRGLMPYVLTAITVTALGLLFGNSSSRRSRT